MKTTKKQIELIVEKVKIESFSGLVDLILADSHIKIKESEIEKVFFFFLKKKEGDFFSIGKFFTYKEYEHLKRGKRIELSILFKLIEKNWDKILDEEIEPLFKFETKRIKYRQKNLINFELFKSYCEKYYEDSLNTKSYFANS
jgi:hypothetical protein